MDVLIDGKVVATCGAGDFFGEMALLEDRPRTATVIARTDVTVDVIGRPEFLGSPRRPPPDRQAAPALRWSVASQRTRHCWAERPAILDPQVGPDASTGGVSPEPLG